MFVGYVLMQIPSNMLITRIKPGIYMSSWMLIWAVVSGCTALVQNFGGLVACRFFLGITEVSSSIEHFENVHLHLSLGSGMTITLSSIQSLSVQ